MQHAHGSALLNILVSGRWEWGLRLPNLQASFHLCQLQKHHHEEETTNIGLRTFPQKHWSVPFKRPLINISLQHILWKHPMVQDRSTNCSNDWEAKVFVLLKTLDWPRHDFSHWVFDAIFAKAMLNKNFECSFRQRSFWSGLSENGLSGTETLGMASSRSLNSLMRTMIAESTAARGNVTATTPIMSPLRMAAVRLPSPPKNNKTKPKTQVNQPARNPNTYGVDISRSSTRCKPLDAFLDSTFPAPILTNGLRCFSRDSSWIPVLISSCPDVSSDGDAQRSISIWWSDNDRLSFECSIFALFRCGCLLLKNPFRRFGQHCVHAGRH